MVHLQSFRPLPSPLLIFHHVHLDITRAVTCLEQDIDLHPDIGKLTSPLRELIPKVVWVSK